MSDTPSGNMPDDFDRLIGNLDGLPDVVKTKPTTNTVIEPIVGHSRTFVTRTYRQRDRGDFVFIEMISRAGLVRLVIPPEVADAIARQRDGLTARTRQKAARTVAAARKAQGLKPGFKMTPAERQAARDAKVTAAKKEWGHK